ncbi:MAG: hypothetical protein ACOVOQ_15400 [Flavobacterium sp.]
MNTVKIKGKDYVPVHERIKWLNENYEYNIETDYQYFPERKMWVVKAKLTIHGSDRNYIYTGLAQEIESDNYREVNHTSALENAETSAVGRACAFANIGIDTGIASADEVQKAINRVEEIDEDARLYLITLLESTSYEERQKEQLAIRIGNIKTQAEYEKALANLQMNQIQDKDRISMGLNYSQSDIKKTLKNVG